ncbi:sigma-70 family RNA polymerase sigma factor [Ramlibacter humi]|uniref:sigma-70 family RNA polymerase sigma factor n=1 Tax=Ramlibacter humi TaxID=2530451 RepID=UPI00142FCBCB|nr:sigma-70 family RNA polymerase sigma factor [Ramlibacter humi]
MTDPALLHRFEQAALPHLDAAYNLARWMTGNSDDAKDVAQEAFLRALCYFGSFRGGDARPWLLQIVRHTCFAWMRSNHPAELVALDDEDEQGLPERGAIAEEPVNVLSREDERAQVNRALAGLPFPYREVLVLREIEDLSYREIAAIADIPIGTVMSRLARGRSLLREALAPDARPALRSVPARRWEKA